MNLLNLFSDPVHLLMQTLVSFGVGAAFYIIIKNQLSNIGQSFVLETKSQINNIEDPDLKEMLRHGIRYVAKRFPNATGNEKIGLLIRAVQDATPNFIISDNQVRELIEIEYDQIKNELIKI